MSVVSIPDSTSQQAITLAGNRVSLEYESAFEDKELAGYLNKKNSMGFWQSRYVTTDKSNFQYWQSKKCHNDRQPPKHVFDIKEIRSIEKKNSRGFIIFFMNDKFKLEFEAVSDMIFREWFGFLKAKYDLYSMDTLLEAISTADNISFQTQSFQRLLLMKEKHQVRWIFERLMFRFDCTPSASESEQVVTLKAAYFVVSDLLQTSEECMLELSASSNPKLVAHCRSFMKRYADMVRGRLVVELNQFIDISSGKKRLVSGIGEQCLGLGIALMEHLQDLRPFLFIPRDLIKDLADSLFSTGELLSILLMLALERASAWFTNYKETAPDQRHNRLMNVFALWSETIEKLDINTGNSPLQQMVTSKVITTQILHFTDSLSTSTIGLLSDSGVDEAALSRHVTACHFIVDRTKGLLITMPAGPFVYNLGCSAYSGSVPDVDATDTPIATAIEDNQVIDAEHTSFVNAHPMSASQQQPYLASPDLLPLSPDLIDAIRSACFSSASYAVEKVVLNMGSTLSDIVQCFFDEKMRGWLGGTTCVELLSRVDSWLKGFLRGIPRSYDMYVITAVIRIVVKMVGMQLFKVHRSKYSKHGIMQIALDIEMINAWIVKTFHNKPSFDATMEGISEHIEQEVEEIQYLKLIHQFLYYPQTALLQAYIKSIHYFGIEYLYHVYDLLRFVLKIRIDCDKSTRMSVLGVTTEFIQQIMRAVASDSTLFAGTRPLWRKSNCILNDLFPKIGVEHITGTKWNLEVLTEAHSIRILVTNLVTEACAHSKSREIKRRQCSSNTNDSKPATSPYNQSAQLPSKPAKPPKTNTARPSVSVTVPTVLAPSAPSLFVGDFEFNILTDVVEAVFPSAPSISTEDCNRPDEGDLLLSGVQVSFVESQSSCYETLFVDNEAETGSLTTAVMSAENSLCVGDLTSQADAIQVAMSICCIEDVPTKAHSAAETALEVKPILREAVSEEVMSLNSHDAESLNVSRRRESLLLEEETDAEAAPVIESLEADQNEKIKGEEVAMLESLPLSIGDSGSKDHEPISCIEEEIAIEECSVTDGATELDLILSTSIDNVEANDRQNSEAGGDGSQLLSGVTRRGPPPLRRRTDPSALQISHGIDIPIITEDRTGDTDTDTDTDTVQMADVAAAAINVHDAEAEVMMEVEPLTIESSLSAGNLISEAHQASNCIEEIPTEAYSADNSANEVDPNTSMGKNNDESPEEVVTSPVVGDEMQCSPDIQLCDPLPLERETDSSTLQISHGIGIPIITEDRTGDTDTDTDTDTVQMADVAAAAINVHDAEAEVMMEVEPYPGTSELIESSLSAGNTISIANQATISTNCIYIKDISTEAYSADNSVMKSGCIDRMDNLVILDEANVIPSSVACDTNDSELLPTTSHVKEIDSSGLQTTSDDLTEPIEMKPPMEPVQEDQRKETIVIESIPNNVIAEATLSNFNNPVKPPKPPRKSLY